MRAPDRARARTYATNLLSAALGAFLGAVGAMWLLWRREERVAGGSFPRPRTWSAVAVDRFAPDRDVPVFDAWWDARDDLLRGRELTLQRIAESPELAATLDPADPLDVPALWRRR